MEERARFHLKGEQELRSLLQGRDEICIIACGRCFQTYGTDPQADAERLKSLAASLGLAVLGLFKIDFLCNETQSRRLLEGRVKEGTAVVSVSCGLGSACLASLFEREVLAAADTVPMRGQQGMALTGYACAACDQCCLNLTGGICPVVDCAKGLLNGPCGGAGEGKCEVDPEKDCAWERIFERMKKQGRLQELLDAPVLFRDCRRGSRESVRPLVREIRTKRAQSGYGGIHPPDGKEDTGGRALIPLREPEIAVFPLSMHAGAMAKPLVRCGEHVLAGQMIAGAGPGISAPVHSSVSGRVLSIEERPHLILGRCLSIVVENDGKGEGIGDLKKYDSLEALSPSEIVRIVSRAGITGMGGAGFPTAVKLSPDKPVDTVLLNGCECEPVLSADHRVMLGFSGEVLFGLQAIMKAVGAGRGLIVIEENKADAFRAMRRAAEGLKNIELRLVPASYPQGAEKVLVRRSLGRIIPSNGLPSDVGCLVDNVSTALAIERAIRCGRPLTERAVTVGGEGMAESGNFIVKIGTPVQELLAACGGILPGGHFRLLSGGPMMGIPVKDTAAPVMKGTGGIVAAAELPFAPQPCILCGRCMDVCPLQLRPFRFQKDADEGNASALMKEKVLDCMECGCCEAVCASRIPLVEKIRAGKRAVRGMKKC